MRSPFYVWSDGEMVTISDRDGWGDKVLMPESVLEELAVMVALELLDPEEGGSREKFVAVVERAYTAHGGNFGADAAARVVGGVTVEAFLQATADRRAVARDDDGA